MTPLDAALVYIGKGWSPIPCKPRSKIPLNKNWEQLTITAADAAQHFRDDRLNVGVRLGPASKNLVDIDLDCDEAAISAPFLLPASSAVFGRQSRRDSHWLFVSDITNDVSIQTAVVNFNDPTRKTDARLLEIRIGATAGCQTIFPPSTHPTGETVSWSNGAAPAPVSITGKDLVTRSRRLAASALIARYWPQRKGTGGHNAARLLGGLLRRAGWTHADISLFVEATARAGMDPDVRDRQRTARDAGEAYDAGKKTAGMPTFERTFGRDVANTLADWLDLKRGAANRPAAAASVGPKPVIRLGPNLAAVAAETERAIFAAGLPVFARDTLLVRPVVTMHRDGKTPVGKFVEIPVPYLRCVMDDAADFQRFDARTHKFVAAKPPAEIAEIVLTRSDHWPFKAANGILMCQSMRPDGSLILAPGYDDATGLFLIGLPAMPAIPDRPTKADAIDSLNILKEVVREFPLVGTQDQSVALSALMTPVVRPALDRVPMHAVSAPDIGSGKTYLVHCCSMLATGHRAPVIALGRSEEETEKRLSALLLDGSPIILLDNVSGPLKGDFLCLAIEQQRIKIRLLGHSETVTVETNSAIYSTGNNLVISGDVVRRAIRGELDPGVEKPWQRAFETKPLETIAGDRGKYIASVLTICRAFRASGAATVQPPLPSFEQWSDLIRSALVWLDEADPAGSIDTSFENDPERENAASVVETWEQTIGLVDVNGNPIQKTAVEAAETANKRDMGILENPDFHRALTAVAKERGGSDVDPTRLGYWLRAHRNQRSNGRAFRRGKKERTGYLWRLELV